MRFLVDTNVVSELRRGEFANPGVQHWGNTTDTNDLAISVITLKELEAGVLGLTKRAPKQGLMLRTWLDQAVVPSFTDRILPIGRDIAIRCAAIELPIPNSLADALIGATALVHNLIVVTRNVKHFEPMGVRFLNPWIES